MMKLWWALVALLGVCAQVWGADPDIDAISPPNPPDTRPTFVVGVQNFYYPPHYFMQNGRYSGFGRDVLDLFAQQQNYRFVYLAEPYIRTVKDLFNGRVDFQYPDNPQWLIDMKADKALVYSAGVVGYVDGISRHSGDVGKPLDSLKRMAMPIGWTAVHYVPRVASGQLEILEVSSVEAVIAMLLRQRVDGVYLNADVVRAHFMALGKDKLVQFDPALPYSSGEFSLSTIKHPAIIAQFDRFLLEQADAVAELKRRYQFKYEQIPAPGKESEN
ncbi:substrate-binding periplasmic protein [Shewanella sedimentimangrovi]|uniref:Solute-binding protein family 3/N-terminal domain-containing protein n=1 Tax=Shewanella sedimentimangrovi TaxID=2814293 RepID=A0ABX7R144_9GAMM|nr:transporter substrate-binding domain-containing protein [Shewanella sedimentimangrovi]QSX37189.1 hypothetical protein JYB85_18405 [Shewanella sedimentimangrovi]